MTPRDPIGPRAPAQTGVQPAAAEPAADTAALLARARGRREATGGAYAGAVTPAEAWRLFSAGAAALVDVRTAAEVRYVGSVPGAQHVEWLGKDDPQVARFVAALAAAVPAGRPLLLLCRSAVRSHHAAAAATRHGWRLAFNVLEGFEGQLDAAGQRGRQDGWRFHGLPWVQD